MNYFPIFLSKFWAKERIVVRNCRDNAEVHSSHDRRHIPYIFNARFLPLIPSLFTLSLPIDFKRFSAHPDDKQQTPVTHSRCLPPKLIPFHKAKHTSSSEKRAGDTEINRTGESMG